MQEHPRFHLEYQQHGATRKRKRDATVLYPKVSHSGLIPGKPWTPMYLTLMVFERFLKTESGCMWDHINHIYNWITRLSPFLFPLGYHKTSIQYDLLKEDKHYTKYEPPLQGSTMSEKYKLEKQSAAESGVYIRWGRSHRSLDGKDCQGVRGWEKEEPQNIYSNGPNKERYLWWFIW